MGRQKSEYGWSTVEQYKQQDDSEDEKRIYSAERRGRTVAYSQKNRSAMRTWGLMRNSIPFGWNDVLKYQHLGVDLLQVKR